MKHSLDLIENLPADARGRLNALGILDMDQLLSRGRTPAGREHLSKKTQIPEADLLKWVEIADLLRVKGIGIKLAQLLVEIEVTNSTYKLAQAAPEDVFALLKAANHRCGQIKKLPSRRAVAELVAEAKELKTVLIFEFPSEFGDQKSRQEQVDQAVKKASRSTDKTLRFLYSLMLAGLFVFVIVLSFLVRTQWSAEDAQLLNLMERVEDYQQVFLLASTANSILMIVLVLSVWRILQKGISKLLDKAETWFLNKPIYRQVSLDLGLSPESIGFLKYRFGISLAVGALYGILLVRTYQAPGYEELRVLTGALIGIVMAAINISPSVSPMIKMKGRLARYTSGALQRYRTWRLISWLYMPVAILLILQLMTALFSAHRFLVSKVYLPAYESSVRAAKDEIMALELQKPGDEAIREFFLSMYTPELSTEFKNLVLYIEEDSTPTERVLLGTFVSICVWAIIASLVAYFIIPLFLLGKFKQALLFLLFTVLSYFSENLLSRYASAWFFLPSGSLTTVIFLAAIVLSNTVLFDWVQEQSSDEKGFCLICGRDHDNEANYCPYCGNAVETGK